MRRHSIASSIRVNGADAPSAGGGWDYDHALDLANNLSKNHSLHDVSESPIIRPLYPEPGTSSLATDVGGLHQHLRYLYI